MKIATTLVLAAALAAAPVLAADKAETVREATPPVPERADVDLEPAGVAPGTTVRQARIAQNWLLLGLGSAALAGILFGLAGSGSDSTSTTN
ncbi:MAG: hypothetical protein QM698_01345 [Micropepsaceae bacterium]